MEGNGKQSEITPKELVVSDTQSFEFSPENYAAIYARKSTLMDNNSIESQIEIAKKKIKASGLFIYNTYSDEESATKYHPIHRPGFRQLLYDANKGKFKTLFVFRRDRLARRVEDLIEIKNIFKKLNIRIIYSNDGEFQSDDNYISVFIENIIMAVDELEPKILAERIASGKYEKRLRGEHCGKAAFGYYIDDKDEKYRYKPDKENAKVVRIVFSLFSKYTPSADMFDKILNQLVSDSSLPKIKKFNKQKVKDIVVNPIYAGLIKLDASMKVSDSIVVNNEGIEIVDDSKYMECTNVKSIIKPKEWYQLLLKYHSIDSERQSLSNDDQAHIFQKLLFCYKCYKPIHLSKGIFRCVKGCTDIIKDDLEQILLRRIIRDIMTKENILNYYTEKFQNYEKKIDAIQRELDLMNKQVNNDLIEVLSIYPTTSKEGMDQLLINIFQLEERSKKLEEETTLKAVESAMKHLLTSNEIDVILNSNNISDLTYRFVRNVDSSKLILQNLIKRILVKGHKREDFYDDSNRKIQYNYTPDNWDSIFESFH